VTVVSRKLQSAHPLVVALLVSATATLASYVTPLDHGTTVVGAIFLGATFLFALPARSTRSPAHFGLSLGGLMEPMALRPARLVRESLRATLQATAVAAIILPPFFVGFELWYEPRVDFNLARALTFEDATHPLLGLVDLVLLHLLVVALPEEAFFRGYLQTALDDRFGKKLRLLGTRFGLSLILTSAVFAVGHLATTPQLGRLAVFFPSLLFGLLRERTGGIGAAMVLHAQCNVAAALIGRGYDFG